MKKLIILMLALAASNTYASDRVKDALVGGILGAVIGNNIGDGDSKSGAVIGAISGVIVGGQHHLPHRGSQYHVRRHAQDHYYTPRARDCRCGTKTIRIEEKIWIPERKVYDHCGKLLYYEPGRYETSYKFRTVPVCG